MRNLATKTRTLRAALDISQVELARRSGVHRTTIRAIESGDAARAFRPATLAALARALHIDFDVYVSGAVSTAIRKQGAATR